MDIGFFSSNANSGQYMMSFFHNDADRIAYRTALNGLQTGDSIVLNTGVISGFGVNTNNASICFTRDTLMLTQDGQKPICDIKVGDMVATMDRGMQPVRWIG
jgi:hypothetical protein